MVAEPAKNSNEDTSIDNEEMAKIISIQEQIQQKKEAEIASQMNSAKQKERKEKQRQEEIDETTGDPNSDDGKGFKPYEEGGGDNDNKETKDKKESGEENEEEDDEESDKKTGIKDSLKSSINDTARMPMAIINRRKIKKIKGEIKNDEKEIKKLTDKLKKKKKLLRSFKSKLHNALMVEMYGDLALSFSKGWATFVTIIGIPLAILWYWSIHIFITLYYYAIKKKPPPTIMRLLTDNKLVLSEKYRKAVERIEKLIEKEQKRIDKIRKKIMKSRRNITELTNLLK